MTLRYEFAIHAGSTFALRSRWLTQSMQTIGARPKQFHLRCYGPPGAAGLRLFRKASITSAVSSGFVMKK